MQRRRSAMLESSERLVATRTNARRSETRRRESVMQLLRFCRDHHFPRARKTKILQQNARVDKMKSGCTRRVKYINNKIFLSSYHRLTSNQSLHSSKPSTRSKSKASSHTFASLRILSMRFSTVVKLHSARTYATTRTDNVSS